MNRQQRARMRLKLYAFYGDQCVCNHRGEPCGISAPEFLHFDHVHGGGTKERQQGQRGDALLRSLYRLMRQGERRHDIRLLCANCNHALGMWGYCPLDLIEEWKNWQRLIWLAGMGEVYVGDERIEPLGPDSG